MVIPSSIISLAKLVELLFVQHVNVVENKTMSLNPGRIHRNSCHQQLWSLDDYVTCCGVTGTTFEPLRLVNSIDRKVFLFELIRLCKPPQCKTSIVHILLTSHWVL